MQKLKNVAKDFEKLFITPILLRTMIELVYLKDSYLRELETKIVEIINERFIVLDKTVFYAQGGGQPFDTGTIQKENEHFKVLSVKKGEGNVLHEVDRAGLKVNDKVNCKIDWNRRYKLMRMHSAAHLLCSIFFKEANVLITGNQLDLEKSRIDFNLEEFDKEKISKYFEKANSLIEQGAEVKVYSLPREEALKIPNVVKLASALPPEVAELRIVEIVGIDLQADGGTHVKNIKEIKGVDLVLAENKGKNNRRVYFALKE